MVRPFNKKIRPTGETYLFHTRPDIEKLMDFCNSLAEKVDELVEENNRLQRKIEHVASQTWRE